MVTIKMADQDYAKIIAALNNIVDTVEDATQDIFNIRRVGKGNIKEVLAYETMVNCATDAQNAWSLLEKNKQYNDRRLIIDM